MSKQLKIGVLIDAACVPDDDPDFRVKREVQSTEYHVVTALRELGYPVSILPMPGDIGSLVEQLSNEPPDLIFNLTEEFKGDRRKDSNIAAVLELMGIPFTGTGARGLMLSRSKALCKQLLSLHRIRVPGFTTVAPGKTCRIPASLTFPLVVKPVYEDGSDGIFNASLVKDADAARQRVAMIHDRWHQPAILEEFIDGRELYVSVLGNRRLTVFPPRELHFRHGDENGPVLATYRVKWDDAYRKAWNIEFGFADLPPEMLVRVGRVCKRAYRVLHIEDYGRIDLRITEEGKIFVLEVNPNPDIAFGDEYAEAAERGGIAYNALIERILRLALRRAAR